LKELKEILQAHSEDYAYQEDIPDEMINVTEEKDSDEGVKSDSDT
jgi:hypothetical protein